MIPVRIPADAPTHVVTRNRTVPAGLAAEDCPVCDLPLGGTTVALVYVGTHPSDRDGRWWTGAAVAVHDECALPPQAQERTEEPVDG